jgi:transcriptional regulator with XRE-family HTH domain
MTMKALREAKNLSTVDVASSLKIGESTIRAWEKGRAAPIFDAILGLLELYGITFEELHQAVIESRKENQQAEANKAKLRVKASRRFR